MTKTTQIKTLDVNEVFTSRQDVRDWVLQNLKQLEDAVQAKFSYAAYNPDAPYIARPDICLLETPNSWRVALMINTCIIRDDDLVRFLTVSSLTDIKRSIWIVDEINIHNHYLLEWLNNRAEGNVEFIVLKLSTYELPNGKIATKLERLKRIPVPTAYDELIKSYQNR